jgi:hypothetical protein
MGQQVDNWLLRRMASSVMLRRVALVRKDVSEELSSSFIRVTIIGELGTTLACQFLVTANVVPSSPILVTLMIEALIFSEMSVLQEPHDVTSQKTPFFIVTAVKISNLTNRLLSVRR